MGIPSLFLAQIPPSYLLHSFKVFLWVSIHLPSCWRHGSTYGIFLGLVFLLLLPTSPFPVSYPKSPILLLLSSPLFLFLSLVFSFPSFVSSPFLVKIVDSGLYFYFFFSLYFIFIFIFILFSIFRTTQVRVYQSHCHKLMVKSQDWLRDLREWSRRFWNKVTSYNMDNTCWPHVIHMVI